MNCPNIAFHHQVQKLLYQHSHGKQQELQYSSQAAQLVVRENDFSAKIKFIHRFRASFYSVHCKQPQIMLTV